MRITEATGDEKFDKMLGNIVTSKDTQGYNSMISKISDPVTQSKDESTEKVFAKGDQLLDFLEKDALTMTDERRNDFQEAYDDDPTEIEDWIQAISGLSYEELINVHQAVSGAGHFLAEFFYCRTSEEFDRNFRQPWENFKTQY